MAASAEILLSRLQARGTPVAQDAVVIETAREPYQGSLPEATTAEAQ